MKVITNCLQGITRVGLFIGGIFLLTGTLLLISNIFGRAFHFVIPGSIEMFELFMAVPVAFGLVYAGLKKGHVIVNLVISRFPPKLAAAAEVFSSVVNFTIWALIAWASGRLAFENGLKEFSETLELPYLPFRLVWTFCLVLFCVVYVLDFTQACRRYLDR